MELNLGKLESDFQKQLRKDLEKIFPGCITKKMEPDDPQGFPDLAVWWGKHYAILECKRSVSSPKRPNQDYYVNLFNEWSFSAFVYPENKEGVLHAMERAWKS